ncbi:unnamed protein product, partial [Hapterophycus canaliculatus]
TALHLTAARVDARFASTFVLRGTSLDVVHGKGQSSLHVAIRLNYIIVADALLRAGADPNSRFAGGGWTPLHCAAFRPNIEGMEALLAKGANMDAVCAKGNTSLHVL